MQRYFKAFLNSTDLSEDMAKFFDEIENATISDLREASDENKVTIKICISHGGFDIAFEKEKEIQDEQCGEERESTAQ